MKVKMKDGVAAFRIQKFGKSWKIPNDEIPTELYDEIKDKVEVIGKKAEPKKKPKKKAKKK